MNTQNEISKLKLNPDELISELYDIQEFQHKVIFKNQKYPWKILSKISSYLQDYFKNQQNKMTQKERQSKIIIGKGTIIQQGVLIKPPAIIGSNCQIRHGAYLRGNVIIGDSSLIGNSSEIKNSILLHGCQISHFNYVGDSIIGNKAHLAAGAITSNLKLDTKPIILKINGKQFETEMIKIGSFIGDNCEIGCNSVINPGIIIGKNTIIYPGAILRQNVNPNCIYKVIQNYQIVQRKSKSSNEKQ